MKILEVIKRMEAGEFFAPKGEWVHRIKDGKIEFFSGLGKWVETNELGNIDGGEFVSDPSQPEAKQSEFEKEFTQLLAGIKPCGGKTFRETLEDMAQLFSKHFVRKEP